VLFRSKAIPNSIFLETSVGSGHKFPFAHTTAAGALRFPLLQNFPLTVCCTFRSFGATTFRMFFASQVGLIYDGASDHLPSVCEMGQTLADFV
jgi:hypothetical protein